MSISYLGIRHHGPGSARSLRDFLETHQPDILLVEGPPEAEALLKLATDSAMKPPVALLTYVQDNPQQAVFHPFAEYSPEWQAILYASQNALPFRFIDLPMVHKLAFPEEIEESKESSDQEESTPAEHPIAYLAEAAGFADAEIWWETTFERRMEAGDSFDAVNEAIAALREAFPETRKNDLYREAYMRMAIREAEKKGFKNIAVICGAWHVPALQQSTTQREDKLLLKGLAKVKVDCTWIPWTYSRLTFASGYGAGVASPGWYHHLWKKQQDISESWLSKVARVFRKEGLDISVSHVIEAVRLSEMLAGLRNLPHPGLQELNEATTSVLCFGDEKLLALIWKELIVSNRIGQVPAEAPAVPLQHDFQKQQKSLRLPAQDEDKVYVFDLRKLNDLERSKLLHRLQLLGIQWGRQEYVSGKGTFKEQWRLRWFPEMMIRLIEMGVWGNTVELAASAYLVDRMRKATTLSELSALLEEAIPAELPEVIHQLMGRINEAAAVSGDVLELMKATTPLAEVSRYGNVRQSDLSLLSRIVESMISRICISLPNACSSLDDEAAEEMYSQLTAVHESIQLLQLEETQKDWQQTLIHLTEGSQTNPMIAGKACRLLHDMQYYEEEEVARKFSQALSVAQEPRFTAAWLEGFLKGSGTILLLDDALWNILNKWVASLEDKIFIELLPLLRRNFSTFSTVERKKLGEKAKYSGTGTSRGKVDMPTSIDERRGKQVMEVVAQILGI